jgi:hypothetical protein
MFCKIKYSWIVLVLTIYFSVVTAQYEDVRCKCVCPSVTPANTSTGARTSGRTIFVKSFHEPSRCKCDNVVDQRVRDAQNGFCERCDCQWQRRNTMTIKVVVMFIICVVSLLVLYMLFLMCLDPLMTKRPTAYAEQRNEEVNLDAQSVDHPPTTPPLVTISDGSSVMSRVRHQVRGEQQRWKGAVQEQRKHIYDHHTMLN